MDTREPQISKGNFRGIALRQKHSVVLIVHYIYYILNLPFQMFSTPSLNFYRKDDKTTSKEKKQTKKILQKQTNKTKEMETKLHKTQK